MLSEISEEYLEEVLDHFGDEKQMLKTIEECNELSRALSRYLSGLGNEKEVRSEIADVYFTISQMVLKFGDKEIDGEVARKMDRVKWRMMFEKRQ